MTAVIPGVVLVDRFRLDAHAPDVGTGVLVGVDQESSQPIVAFEVPKAWVHPVRAGVGIAHLHRATLLGDVVLEGHHVLVADRVAGETLSRALARQGPLLPAHAVKASLRLADALESLHLANACHGFIHPGGIVIAAEGRSSPVLAYVAPLETNATLRAPESNTDAPPSPADDTWSLGTMLFQMLTGRTPSVVGYVAETDLQTAGIDDPELQVCLQRVLDADPEKRGSLQDLKRDLARWFVEHASERTEESGAYVMPPPLPSTPPPPSRVEASLPPVSAAGSQALPNTPRAGRPRRFVPVFAALGVGAGIAAAYGVSSLISGQDTVVEVPRNTAFPETEPEAPDKAEPASVSLSAVPVTGESERPLEQTASCVAAHLPKGAFNKTPKLDWLCEEADPREGAGKLRVAVVEGSGGTQITDAMRVFSKLGWYEMAAFAVVRGGCCAPDSPPITLPEPAEGCASVVTALSDVSRAALAGHELETKLGAVEQAFACEASKHRASVYRRKTGPQGHEQAAFRELLKSLSGD